MEDCRDTNSRDHEGWSDRIKVVRCDGRVAGSCGAAVTEAVEVFGGIDILLCCNNEGMSPDEYSLLPHGDLQLKK